MENNILVHLDKSGDIYKGYLSFFETNKDIPFEIKRIYYIYDVPLGKKRGMHAHKTLCQVFGALTEK